MSAGLSEVQIYNMALDLLDEPPAFNPTDDRAAVRFCKRNFPLVRDILLTSGEWHFARQRAELAEELTTPAFTWDKKFKLPADCLRLIPLTLDAEFEAPPVQYELESGYILTNESGPLPIRYVRQMQTGELPILFCDYIAANLATRGAQRITGKGSYFDRCASANAEARKLAESVNAAEKGTIERAHDQDFIEARYGRWTG